MSNKIFAFCCENAVNDVNIPDLTIIKLPCSGRLDALHILKAFENGAHGLLILACYEGACKFISGNIKTKKRLEYAKNILKQIGIDDDKVQMHHVQINQEQKLKEIVQDFKNRISGGKK